MSAAPPEGVFYNRMSASSHTRGHRYAPELTAGVARVARIARPARGEQRARARSSRSARSRSTRRCARTASARRARSPPSAPTHIVAAARALPAPVHHQAQPRRQGSRRAALPRRRRARGVRAQRRVRAFGRRHHADAGIHRARPQPFITRVEFVGGALPLRGARGHLARLRAVPGRRVPGRRCVLPGRARRRRPQPRRASASSRASPHPIVERYQRFLAANGIGIAGIEFITDAEGELYTYDVNTNTNYNRAAEAAAGRFGMRAIARLSRATSSRAPIPTGLARRRCRPMRCRRRRAPARRARGIDAARRVRKR